MRDTDGSWGWQRPRESNAAIANASKEPLPPGDLLPSPTPEASWDPIAWTSYGSRTGLRVTGMCWPNS